MRNFHFAGSFFCGDLSCSRSMNVSILHGEKESVLTGISYIHIYL